jgi:hypothetical protein
MLETIDFFTLYITRFRTINLHNCLPTPRQKPRRMVDWWSPADKYLPQNPFVGYFLALELCIAFYALLSISCELVLNLALAPS